jgi:outer membrane protein assembly factor BamB
MKQVCLLLLALTYCTSFSYCDDWYRWRGPNLNGISPETNWQTDWTDSKPEILWNASVGTGFSSVTVQGNRLYTMGNANNTDTVYCLDVETGDTVWSHSYESPLDDKLFEGGPTSTPTIDENRVYTISRNGQLFCFDAGNGEIQWQKNLPETASVRIPGWGYSCSPLIHENLLLLNAGDAGVALNKNTGELVWTSTDTECGYSTPMPFTWNNKQYAVFTSAKFYIAADIETGKELWRHRWLTRYGLNAAEPIFLNNHVLISSGYGKGATLLKMNGSESGEMLLEEIWKNKNMCNQVNSSILLDGSLYGINGDLEKGELQCIDYMSGEAKWSASETGAGSLIAANNHLIILSEKGELMIAPASPDSFQPTLHMPVIDDKCWTPPTLANGRIYCRGAHGDVICIDVSVKH